MTFANRKFIGFLGAATIVIVAEYVLVLSDSVIAGRMIGEEALGAMNLLMPVFMTVSFFTWLLAVGTSIVYSDAMARMQRDRAANLAGQGLVASVLVGLALCAAILAFKGPYLAFMAPGAGTAGYAAAYLKWFPVVAVLEAVDLVLLYLVYTDGGEICCTVSYCAQVIVNLVLSYGLCSGEWGLPALGMGGIALGTAVAYVSGAAMLLPRLAFSRECGIRFVPKFLPRDFARSLALSFGDASSGLFQALLFFVTTKYLIRGWGSDILPVATVVFFVIRLSLFFNGVGIALQPMETVYHGEGNVTAIRRLVRFAACVSVFEGLFLTAVVFIAPELFADVVGIDDPALVVGASQAARLTVVGLAGYALTYMLNSHYQYVGRPDRSVKLTALAFFAVPAALLFALGGAAGVNGVWVALAAGPTVTVVAFLALPSVRRAKPAARAMDTHVWSVEASDPAACAEVVKEVGATLSDSISPEAARQVVRTLAPALRCIRERNGKGRRIQSEITVKPEANGARLIVRDDGHHFAIDSLDCPVLHLPAAGFNRNIFIFAQPRDQFEDRYEILRGIDMTLEEVRDVVALDDRNFDACYHSTPEQNWELFKTNRESGFVVRDRETGQLVGYTMLLPVDDSTYLRIRKGAFMDTELTPEMVLKYDAPGIYHLYFTGVVVHPDHRSARMVLAMFNAMIEDFIALSERGIFIDRMIADVVTLDGKKFCRFFGLDKVCESNHHSTIYEVLALPPKFRMTTPSTRRLEAAYKSR
ncbi:MAG: hypothetical protein J6T51_01195 [Kiritimatiellae bacterium]|nr:hypothetical protein [Kiritimatiellia bacterium]